MGKAEASSARLAATKRVITVTSGQPRVITERAAEAQAVAVERHRAGEDGDDGEREGEVGEAAHVAQELLGVAEAGEIGGVAVELGLLVGIGLHCVRRVYMGCHAARVGTRGACHRSVSHGAHSPRPDRDARFRGDGSLRAVGALGAVPPALSGMRGGLPGGAPGEVYN